MKSKLVLLLLVGIKALSVAIFQTSAHAKSSLKDVSVEYTFSGGREHTEAK